MRLQKSVNWLFPLLGLPVIGFFFYRLGLDHLTEVVRTMGWGLVPLLLVVPFWLYVIHAIGWGFTMSKENRQKLGWIRLSALQTFSYGISGMIPLQGIVGEPLKLAFLQGTDYDKEDFTASLLLDNTINGIAIFVFGAAGLVYMSLFLVTASWLKAVIFGLVAFFCVVFFLLIMVQKRGLFTWVLEALGRVHAFTAFRDRHIDQVHRVDATVREFYQNNRNGFYAALFFHVVEKWQGVIEFWLIFHLLGMDVSWGMCFFLFSVTSTLDNLLFFAQVGGMEVWVSQLIAAMKITQDSVNITVALLRRMRLLLWAVLALVMIGPTRRLLGHVAADAAETQA